MSNASKDSETYRPVEAIGRGLAVLEALSTVGWASMSELHGLTNIQRSSLYRITQTLVGLGYVARRGEDGKVALTYKVHQLGDGLREDDVAVQTVRPHMKALTRQILWPSDFASLRLGACLIRYSTHRFSPMSIHGRMIGRERSITRSALGKAIISAMSPQEVEQLRLTLGEQSDAHGDLSDPDWMDLVTRTTRRDGYASSIGQTEEGISAIALPVRNEKQVYGAINIIFFRSTMTPAEAADRFLPQLRACCDDAVRDLATKSLA